ncbi:peptidoglycan DD-metalloendopeptidase family protein [Glaciimonas immobilis]|uniref:Murein DD-endopeptidase MepM/ murein hydrolase activator NlpD n=1 Tax=Glaciimonas immobilis TaxID=728004 RepID=A0A840RNU9_9BURK|nr:peptidoglycan DD-metalloendopeptidase family protein [Glaciimonas immobilis]KAF3998926.1 peptidoglycan DD-metalloendopeptidase family protein [Glaciimonas immobilis]MBB5198330.1 murein DD-endopeptidase MepM/ murein hydrolase activator NlpD [Glaciimonas immobilis]
MHKIRLTLLVFLIVMIAACSTTSGSKRDSPGARNSSSNSNSTDINSGPGYYTVQKGDTLYSIGRKFKQDHRQIGQWNKLEDLNGIEIGQVLRVVPTDAVTAASTKKPVFASQNVGAPTESPPATLSPANGDESSLDWLWPTEGTKTSSYSLAKKGIEIAGKSGQPILATASGKVMYAGAGIRGYGNLIIVKHTGSLLSVYAHNNVILAKEGQMVSKGQKIAEMGKSDSNTVKLYFEIRRNGKPIDPAIVFPRR